MKREFRPDKESFDRNERLAAYAIEAGDPDSLELADELERKHYRIGGEGDCCHEYVG